MTILFICKKKFWKWIHQHLSIFYYQVVEFWLIFLLPLVFSKFSIMCTFWFHKKCFLGHTKTFPLRWQTEHLYPFSSKSPLKWKGRYKSVNKNITGTTSEDWLEVGKEMDPISRNQSKRYLNPKHTPGRLYRSESFFPTETSSNSYSINKHKEWK